MKKGGGAAKGSSFERDICKQLSLWWTFGERDDVFWRTAGSGGRATNRAKKGIKTSGAYGDIAATDQVGEPLMRLCSMEIKRGYGQWCMLDLVDRKESAKPSTAALFWAQAKESADQAGVAHPVVIFKRDQKRTCVIFGRALLNVLAPHCGPHRGVKIQTQIGNDSVIIMPFAEFLEYVDPDVVRNLLS